MPLLARYAAGTMENPIARNNPTAKRGTSAAVSPAGTGLSRTRRRSSGLTRFRAISKRTLPKVPASDCCRQRDPENIFLARRIASLTPAREDAGCRQRRRVEHRVPASSWLRRATLAHRFRSAPAFAVEHIPNSTFQRREFEDLTEESGPFDVIVMSHVLEHSLHPLDWLKHAAKLLSPEGILAIAIPNFGGVYRFLGSGPLDHSAGAPAILYAALDAPRAGIQRAAPCGKLHRGHT